MSTAKAGAAGARAGRPVPGTVIPMEQALAAHGGLGQRLHKMPLAGQGQELLGWERSWENPTLSMRDEGPAGSRSCSGEGSE